MATSSLSRRRGLGLNWRVIMGMLLILLAIATAVLLATSARPSAAAAPATITVTRGHIVGSVSGSGSITAEQALDLPFQTNGVVAAVLVEEGDEIMQGQVLAQLDDRALQSRVASAQASLDGAQARLLQLQKGNARPEDLTSARAAITSAQAGYNAAVKDAQSGDSTLASLKASLDKAQVTVQQAQAAYDRIGGATNPNIGLLPQSRDLQSATIEYQRVQADYQAQLVKSGPDAQARIQSALATLQQAQANLAKLTAPATDTDLAIQQAAVAQAEQSLKQAQLSLEDATLKAPFAGVVTSVDIVAGGTVNGGRAVMTLIDPHPLHVSLKLSENDVVRVRVGQPVTLTIDSLSNWRAQGQVSYIAPAAQSSNGVVTYAVRVTLNDGDPRVQVGMTANLNIVTADKDNVLLVPNSALLPKGSGRVVEVVGPDGKQIEVEVQTGITDGAQTEIVSGLSEGQKIIPLPGTSGTQRMGMGMFGG